MRLFSFFRQEYTPLSDGNESPPAFAADFSVFFVTPLQIWLGRLVSQVWKAGSIEDDWLPRFSCNSSHLRAVAAALGKNHHAKLAFLGQREIIGMLLLGAMFEAFTTGLTLSAPLLLHRLLLEPSRQAAAWALVLVTILATLAKGSRDQVCRIHSIWITTMLRATIFEKSLHLSPKERVVYPPEKIINMSGIDVEAVGMYVWKIHEIWSAPLQIVVIAVLVVSIMGASGLCGFFLMLVVFVSGQGWASRAIRRTFVSYITLNDRRLGVLRDLLYNLKSIRALAYESVFQRLISRVRDEQIAALRFWLLIMFGYFTAINLTIPALTAIAAFLTYYLTGNELTSAVVFPSLAYFGMLHQPISQASMAIARQFSTMPCFLRLWSLMKAEETESSPVLPAEHSSAAIRFDDASFLYPGSRTSTLRVGSLRIPRGQFTVITGPTGAGKSSLLKAILGEMTRISGTCSVYGSVSYAPQDPWIMSGTLRDNIVFAGKYDPVWYSEVISMCGLDYDFRLFPGAGKMQANEAGSNLSGGQRARISLARSLYARSDILLLEDPLSAVDGNVGELLFESIRSLEKTVIMVTQQISHVTQVDNVIAIQQNQVRWTGPAKEFSANPSLYSSLCGTTTRSRPLGEESIDGDISVDEHVKNPFLCIQKPHNDEMNPGSELLEEEERTKGGVQFRHFKFYTKCAGGVSEAFALLFGAISSIIAKIISSYWFVWWIGDVLRLEKTQYIGGYLGITISQTIIQAGSSLILVYGSIKASGRIHNTIIDGMLTAPLSFFEQQPVGRILNRMSTDMDLVDTRLMNAVEMALSNVTAFIASLCLVASSAFVTIGLLLPFIFVIGWIQAQFRVCAREIQRSALILKSPTVSILSESLRAPSSIKVYNAINFSIERHRSALDMLMSAEIVRRSLDTWLTLRVEFASTLLLLFSALLTVYGIIPAATAGLTLSTVMTIAKNVSSLIWTFTELEIKMISVERLERYCNHIPERQSPDLAVYRSVPKHWPFNSTIEMKDVKVKYQSRPTPALDDFNLRIKGGERVGIIGRTGCGKSTLVSTIPRLVNIANGTITIDGVDISTVEPQKLRSVVCTISQEPLIFEGTLRENLDPIGAHTDEEILNILELCQLKSSFSSAHNKDPLSQHIKSCGVDFSAGQRQLLCVARALLTNPPILLVDEATANVDSISDAAIQRALQSMPLNTTIIVITHRAASLTWMDRILVMDDGKITEDSPPLALLQKANNKKHYEGMATESYYRAAVRIEGNKALQQAIQSAKASAKARLCEKSRRIEDTRKEDQTNPSCEKIPVDEQRAGSSL